MDFARKQLEKYGWTDGKGLGKNENGISQALKPKLKRSMTGVGHNAASDFTEHWWSTLYNKAASNIEVKEKDGTTKKIKTKDDTGFEITNSTWKLKRKKTKHSYMQPQEQYEDFFVKTAVLGSGGQRTDRIKDLESESDDEHVDKDVLKMTDEELFAACEGRTAHKGARHGLKALGKLARIEQQEKLLLQQSRFNVFSHTKRNIQNKEYEEETLEAASLNCDKDVSVLKKKKKKKKHCLKQEMDEHPNDEIQEICVNSFNTTKEKKKSICNVANTDFEDETVDESLPKKMKKKKLITMDEKMHGGKKQKLKECLQSDVSCGANKKLKKSKCLEVIDGENCDTDVNNLCKLKSNKKNKKTVSM